MTLIHVIAIVVSRLMGALVARKGQAELTVIKDADGQQGLTVFKMTVTPAAEPVPALKHRLTLRERELKSGNAATHYSRAFPKPLDGVKRNDREGFVAAWGDGHASLISNDADAGEFAGNLTYAGGEESKP